MKRELLYQKATREIVVIIIDIISGLRVGEPSSQDRDFDLAHGSHQMA